LPFSLTFHFVVIKTLESKSKVSKVLSRASRAYGTALISISCSPQPDTTRSRKTTDMGPVHRVVCPFTPQLSLVLINRPRRDGTLSWRWKTLVVVPFRLPSRTSNLYWT